MADPSRENVCKVPSEIDCEQEECAELPSRSEDTQEQCQENTLKLQNSASDDATVEEDPSGPTNSQGSPNSPSIEPMPRPVSHPMSKHRGPPHSSHVPSAQNDDLAEQLSQGTYECMICCGSVQPIHHVWSCCTCYNVFHLRCINEWASRAPQATEDSTPTTAVFPLMHFHRDSQSSPASQAGKPANEKWYCPGRRHPFEHVPSLYMCFCRGTANPFPAAGSEQTPHTCGEICRLPLAKDPLSLCRHTCPLPCHPGPCPRCLATALRDCPCGKKQRSMPCSEVVDVCGEPCSKLRSCGTHVCLLECHKSPCPPCNYPVERSCSCGRESRVLSCHELRELEKTDAIGEVLGCKSTCDKLLSCSHRCEQKCHPGQCAPCALSPENVSSCPCGKMTALDRTFCFDPVPTCDNVCGRRLPCSTHNEEHFCEKLCHHGDCPDCPHTTSVRCRCGRSSGRTVECREVKNTEEFRCDSICNQKKHCGCHRCSTRCCSLAEHRCELTCGKQLRCGRHMCEEVSHKGRCPGCQVQSHEELRCHCGAEVILPPVPCGTLPPPCSEKCSRRHPCSHPVCHSCHSEPTCPRCIVMTRKMCQGGHKACSVFCFIEEVLCGLPCAKELPCGHKCSRTCHTGPCLPEGKMCTLPGSLPRKQWGHPCASACHFGKPCPESALCRQKITLFCRCRRIKKKSLCLWPNRDNLSNFSWHKSDYTGLVVQLTQREAISEKLVKKYKFVKPIDKKLDCDELCEFEEPGWELPGTSDFQFDATSDSAVLDESMFPDSLYQAAKSNKSDRLFLQEVDKSIRQLVEVHLKKPASASSSIHSFPATCKTKRQCIRKLAKAYGCKAQSSGTELVRGVVVRTTSESFLPSMSLMKFIDEKSSLFN